MPVEEASYSKRELDTHFKNLLEHMQSFETSTGESLDRIEQQVGRTNGRVSKLENWKWFITGGLAILTVLVIPLILALLQSGKL